MSEKAPEPRKTQYRVHDNKVYMEVVKDLYSTWVQATQVHHIKAAPVPIWKGALIPFEMWRLWLSFCQLTQEKFKSEAMLLLFYNVEKEEWAFWIPPQETMGMTVSLLDEDPLYSLERKLFCDLQFGTVHHHCTSSAFASGVDKDDEIDREGLHFTIGNLDKDILDIHSRFSIEGSCHVIDEVSVVAMPDWLANNVPTEYQYDLMKSELCRASEEEELAAAKELFLPHLTKIKKTAYKAPVYQGQFQGRYWENFQKKNTAKGLGTAKKKASPTPLIDVEEEEPSPFLNDSVELIAYNAIVALKEERNFTNAELMICVGTTFSLHTELIMYQERQETMEVKYELMLERAQYILDYWGIDDDKDL